MATVKFNLKPKPVDANSISLDGNRYNYRYHWNVYTGKWYMRLTGINNEVDIAGMALLCGKNLLQKYGYLSLGSLEMIDKSGANEDPNYDEIGSRFVLEYTSVE